MAHRWRVLALVSVAVFLVSLDLFVVNVAFPEIAAAYPSTDVATISWVLNAYAIVLAALMVPAGRLADRHGRRLFFLAGLGVFALGSALCAAAASIELLIAARALQAVGAAALLPTSLALLLPEFPAAERPAAIGVWAAVGGIAAACGPPLGGLLVELSWRLIFLINLPIALLALIGALRLLGESREEGGKRPDLGGAVILAFAAGLLALALVQAPEWGWTSAATVGSLAAAAVGIGAFWWRCLSHPQPLVEPALVRVRGFALANGSSLLFSVSFAAMLLGNVLFTTEVWGYSAMQAGLALAPGPLAAAVLAVLTGRALPRLGSRLCAGLGTGLFALGCAWWVWRLGGERAYVEQMLPGLLITGVGVGLTLPSLASAAAGSLPPQRFATGSAVFTMSRQLGFVLGVAALVSILGADDPAPSSDGFAEGWLFMAIAAALGSAVAAGLPSPPQVAPVPVAARREAGAPERLSR